MACRVYNQRFQIKEEDRQPDDIGGYPNAWKDVAGLSGWCSIEGIRGKEILLGAKLQSEVSHKIYIPFNPSAPRIRADMSLVHNNRWFNIRYAIVIKERNQEWELLADEGVAP
jgi:SPP1 family predicted phage head-tail adaptor